MWAKITFWIATCLVVFGVSSADDCIGCSSLTEDNCAQNPGVIKPSKCPFSEKSNCYTRVVSGITYRGCVSELDQAVRDTCMNDSLGLSCMICENANGVSACNNAIFPLNRLSCHSCAENGLKGNCFTGTDARSALPCKKYQPDDKCFIHKTAKSITRDCLSETTKCTNMSHCFICDGDGCNNLIGNNTVIPVAPNSAAAWTSTFAFMILPALIFLQ